MSECRSNISMMRFQLDIVSPPVDARYLANLLTMAVSNRLSIASTIDDSKFEIFNCRRFR